MGRKDEVLTILVLMQRGGLQVGRIEPLRIHHGPWNVPENHEFLRRQPEVVAVGRATETENGALAVLGIEMTHQTL